MKDIINRNKLESLISQYKAYIDWENIYKGEDWEGRDFMLKNYEYLLLFPSITNEKTLNILLTFSMMKLDTYEKLRGANCDKGLVRSIQYDVDILSRTLKSLRKEKDGDNYKKL